MEQKPHWMADHEREDARRFDEVLNALRDINNTLKPIADIYRAAGLVGKWGMAALVFLSVLFGVILSFRTLFKT